MTERDLLGKHPLSVLARGNMGGNVLPSWKFHKKVEKQQVHNRHTDKMRRQKVRQVFFFFFVSLFLSSRGKVGDACHDGGAGSRPVVQLSAVWRVRTSSGSSPVM